jgi:hypothetical protein
LAKRSDLTALSLSLFGFKARDIAKKYVAMWHSDDHHMFVGGIQHPAQCQKMLALPPNDVGCTKKKNAKGLITKKRLLSTK